MTFSIVARDAATGQLGLAVASHVLAVGRAVHHVRPGVGAVASQASALYAHGTRILSALGRGMALHDALDSSLARDHDASTRQVIAIDTSGATAVHTGSDCIRFAGHHQGPDVAMAGNILADAGVLAAMVDAGRPGFDTSAGGPSLARRLVAVLEAAQDAGGDQRGRQSASLVVVAAEDTGDPLVDRMVDVRVDDHAEPIAELARLVELAEVHHEFELAEHDLGQGRVDRASLRYEDALGRIDGPEFHVWAAVALVEAGLPDRARELVRHLRDRDDAARWQEFLRRLAEAGMVDPDLVTAWTTTDS